MGDEISGVVTSLPCLPVEQRRRFPVPVALIAPGELRVVGGIARLQLTEHQHRRYDHYQEHEQRQSDNDVLIELSLRHGDLLPAGVRLRLLPRRLIGHGRAPLCRLFCGLEIGPVLRKQHRQYTSEKLP